MLVSAHGTLDLFSNVGSSNQVVEGAAAAFDMKEIAHTFHAHDVPTIRDYAWGFFVVKLSETYWTFCCRAMICGNV